MSRDRSRRGPQWDDVSYRIVTDGDAGGLISSWRDEMARIRRAEQTAAATVGVSDLHFLAYPDGRLQLTIEPAATSKVIRAVRPQRVASRPSALGTRLRESPDHLAAGEARCAVYPDAQPVRPPELLAAGSLWTVPQLWLMAHPGVNVYVDTTDTIDKKINKRCSATRARSPTRRARPAHARVGSDDATCAGLEGRMAEAFQSVDAA